MDSVLVTVGSYRERIACFELHLLCKTHLTSYQVLCDDCLCTNTIVPQEMRDGVLVTVGSYLRTVVYDTVGGDDSDPVYETVDVKQRVATGPETRENVAYGVTDGVSTKHNSAYVAVNTRP